MRQLTISSQEMRAFTHIDDTTMCKILGAMVMTALTDRKAPLNDAETMAFNGMILPILSLRELKSKAGSASANISRNIGNKHASKSNQNKSEQIISNQKPTDIQQVTDTPKIEEVKEETKEQERKEETSHTLKKNKKEIEKKEENLKELVEKKAHLDSLTPEERANEVTDDDYKFLEHKIRFYTFMQKYPRFMSLKHPLTYDQYQHLINDKGLDPYKIRDTLEELENYKPLTSKYIDCSRTLLNWYNIKYNKR